MGGAKPPERHPPSGIHTANGPLGTTRLTRWRVEGRGPPGKVRTRKGTEPPAQGNLNPLIHDESRCRQVPLGPSLRESLLALPAPHAAPPSILTILILSKQQQHPHHPHPRAFPRPITPKYTHCRRPQSQHCAPSWRCDSAPFLSDVDLCRGGVFVFRPRRTRCRVSTTSRHWAPLPAIHSAHPPPRHMASLPHVSVFSLSRCFGARSSCAPQHLVSHAFQDMAWTDGP